MILLAPEDRAPGYVVLRNGVEVSSALFGTPIPVDEGVYKVRITAPGFETNERSIRIQGEATQFELQLPELKPERSVQRSAAPAPVETDTEQPSRDTARAEVASPLRPIGLATGIVGVALMGGSVALGFIAKSRAKGADCDADNQCSDDGIDDRDAAVEMGNVATGIFVAGGVLAAGGFSLYLLAPQPQENASVSLSPWGSGAQLTGRW